MTKNTPICPLCGGKKFYIWNKELLESVVTKNQTSTNCDECWVWPFAKDNNGYGIATHNGKQIRAHRLSYLLFKGSPDGCMVLHACDWPSCVNPSHLSLGQAKENYHDAMSKGRLRRFYKTKGLSNEVKEELINGFTQSEDLSDLDLF